MPPLPTVVRDTCRRRRMLPRGSRVLVAVSGGPDSVALLRVLLELTPEMSLRLGVAHFNHHIRGAAADEDAGFVAGLAHELGLPFCLGEADVPALAREAGMSLEQAAREARYSFLRSAASEGGYDLVAVAHTRDDQAETVLLAMIRGSGVAGQAGMAPSERGIVRPLIDATRADVISYLDGRGIAARTDQTNLDPTYLRNRVRLKLLPLLETEFGRSVSAVLARQADLMRADEELLAAVTAEFLTRAARTTATQCHLDRGMLLEAPLGLRRRAVRQAAEGLLGGAVPPLSLANVEGVLGLLEGRTGDGVDLPAGLYARLDYDALVLGKNRPLPPGPVAATELTLPGLTVLDEQGWRFSLEILEPPGPADWPWQVERDAEGGSTFRALLDLDKLSPPLRARSRRPGDRFWPHGSPGQRKLQDFLTDARVPRASRDALPLIEDSTGRIAAVVPLRAAQWACVDSTSRRVLSLVGRIRVTLPGT